MKVNKFWFFLILIILFPLITKGLYAYQKTKFQKHDPACPDNIVVKWTRVFLEVFRLTFGFLSPPMTSRAIFIFTASIYDSIVPYTSDL